MLRLAGVPLLHARGILHRYIHLQSCNNLAFNGFRAAGMTDTVEKANKFFHRAENLPNI